MPPPLDLVRPEIRAERAYRVPTTLVADAKVDQNESPYDLPDEIKRAALDAFAATPWNRYPDDRPHRLVRAIEEREGLPAGSVIVGRGSNELTHTLGLCFVDAGTPVVLPSPMFALFASMARMHGADVVDVPAGPDLRHDADAILAAAVDANAPLVVVTTPNNPTGQTIPHADLDRLAAGVPGVLVIDEAYHEFLGGRTATDLLKAHDNVLVMRTFSKAFGLAGVRLGVMLGHPDLIAEIEKSRLPFLVDRLGEEIGLAILDRPDLLDARVEELMAERAAQEAWFAAQEGVEVLPGVANFFLVRTPLEPRALMEAMAAHGVLIRHVSGYPALAGRDGRPGWVRVSIGAPAENEAVRTAFSAVLSLPA